METIIGGYKISKISAGEMANYFERAFSRSSVKEMISNAAFLSAGEGAYKNFGNILQAYTSATGDLSDETIDRLAKDFETNGQKCNAPLNNDLKLEGIQVYFGEHVMPLMRRIIVKGWGLSRRFRGGNRLSFCNRLRCSVKTIVFRHILLTEHCCRR